jgi:hypothetical protein
MMKMFAVTILSIFRRNLSRYWANTEKELDGATEEVGKLIEQGACHGEDRLNRRKDGVDDAGKDLKDRAKEVGESFDD